MCYMILYVTKLTVSVKLTISVKSTVSIKSSLLLLTRDRTCVAYPCGKHRWL